MIKNAIESFETFILDILNNTTSSLCDTYNIKDCLIHNSYIINTFSSKILKRNGDNIIIVCDEINLIHYASGILDKELSEKLHIDSLVCTEENKETKYKLCILFNFAFYVKYIFPWEKNVDTSYIDFIIKSIIRNMFTCALFLNCPNSNYKQYTYKEPDAPPIELLPPPYSDKKYD